MKKITLAFTLSLILHLAGFSLAYADDNQPAPSPPVDVVNPPAVSPPPADASQCSMKTDLSADMVAKCSEAMANGNHPMLAGCCQESNIKQEGGKSDGQST